MSRLRDGRLFFRSDFGERPGQALIYGVMRLLDRLGDGDAFSRREPIFLDHDRKPLALEIGLGVFRVVEPLIGSGRNSVSRTQIFGETLGALKPRSGPARPEHFDALCLQIVGDAGDQRHLRPNHDKVDAVRLAESSDRRMVCDIELDAFRDLGDPGIAGCAIELFEQGALLELPGERMLPPARAYQQQLDQRFGSHLLRRPCRAISMQHVGLGPQVLR